MQLVIENLHAAYGKIKGTTAGFALRPIAMR